VYHFLGGLLAGFGAAYTIGRANYYYDIKSARLIRHQTSGGREMMEPQRIK